MMKYFFLKLNPPRADFSQTMNADERKMMESHVVYWKKWLDSGKILAFGPVLDPKGTYGIGIVSVEDETDLDEFQKNDPAMLSKLGFSYERYAMPRLMVRQ